MLAYVTGEIEESLLRRIEYLIEENRVLRHQIEKRILLNDAERRILAEKAVALGKLMADTVAIVKPETILKWHRRLVAKKFDGSQFRKKCGRPPISPEVEKLVIKMAQSNPAWGYDRLAGAITNLGHCISDQTVGNILRRNGIAPAPERRKSTTWASFIRRHREVLWATDFFTTEIWTCHGLTTYYVLFFIHLFSRKVVLGGVTTSPHETWMKQVARNLTGWSGEIENAWYLIHDRDSKYTKSFDAILESSGIKPVRLPAKSPNLNAFAERFVRSIKAECLDALILFGERSLRHVVREYLAHYHAERNHQGIGNIIPFPDKRSNKQLGRVVKSERLGGLLNFYHREAA
jgi:transposase InsO family protein